MNATFMSLLICLYSFYTFMLFFFFGGGYFGVGCGHRVSCSPGSPGTGAAGNALTSLQAACFKHNVFLGFVLWNKQYLCFGLNKQSRRGDGGRGRVGMASQDGSPGKGERGAGGSVAGPSGFWMATGRSSCWPDNTWTV